MPPGAVPTPGTLGVGDVTVGMVEGAVGAVGAGVGKAGSGGINVNDPEVVVHLNVCSHWVFVVPAGSFAQSAHDCGEATPVVEGPPYTVCVGWVTVWAGSCIGVTVGDVGALT